MDRCPSNLEWPRLTHSYTYGNLEHGTVLPFRKNAETRYSCTLHSSMNYMALSNVPGWIRRKGDLLKNFHTPDNLSWLWSVIEAKPPE